MSSLLLERLHLIKGLDPVADAFSGTVTSDVVNMESLDKVLFLVHVGVGATGTSTFTVEACDDVVPTNVDAVPFHYRQITTGDTEGALTRAAEAGFTNTAGSSKLVAIEVDASDLGPTGYGFVRLKAVESVDSPVLGGISIIGQSRIPSSSKATAIV